MARILLVDDNAALRGSMARNLVHLGHEIAQAEDGLDAIAHMEEDPRFEVVLLDLEMPRMNGRATVLHMLSRFPTLARRTIVVTGAAIDDATQEWIDRDVGGFFAKPVSIERLRFAIDRLCAT